MRIDKFLKVSRLVKRRETAKQLCGDNDVKLNGRSAKPMAEVKEGDVLILALGRHAITVKILSVRPFANKENAASMYQIISDIVNERSNQNA